MKRFAKILCALLAAILPLGAFAACGGAASDVLYVLSFKPEYDEIFEEVNQIFLDEHPEMSSVDYRTVDTNNYNSVFTSRIQSGYLDVFTSEVTYMMQGSNNYMEPLEHRDYMDDVADEYLTLGSFYDPSEGGEPELLTMPIERVANVVYYNKTIFDEYGLSEPTTWEEFCSVCQTFSDAAKYPVAGRSKIESPIIFGARSEWPAMTILNSVVADVIGINQPDFFDEIVNYDTNTNIRFNNDNWVEVFNKTQQIGTQYVDNDIYGLDYSFAATYFSIGNTTNNSWYPMMIDGTWVNSQITAEFEVGAFALPAVSDPTNAEGKKNLSVKTGATLSVFNRSNKKDAAQDYIEIFFRDEIYQKFVDFAKTPSVKETVEQTDTLVNSIFDENKYTFVEAYDSRMPRYFPLVSASEAVALMKGQITAQTVADTLQNQVELNKVDWQEYTQLSHTKSRGGRRIEDDQTRERRDADHEKEQAEDDAAGQPVCGDRGDAARAPQHLCAGDAARDHQPCDQLYRLSRRGAALRVRRV